jgi:NAD(P)-dependent dehydrogenase (short-subunit alcohol dehydrogenase family)
MGQLDGKVAVVTGGSEGIGAATARRFALEGATVFVTGRRQAELDTTVKEINAQHNGGQAIAVRSDVSVLADLDRLYARVQDQSDRIDVLFANAGVVELARLEDITEAHFDRTFGVNVRGLLFTVQKALPLLADGASVILPSSVAASKGIAGTGVYNATKAAVRNFARTWAGELASRGIRVNAVSPGPIETPGFSDFSGVTTDRAKAERVREDFLATVPMGRMGDPDEVAAAVVFLASDASTFTTGAEVFVDGGQAQV